MRWWLMLTLGIGFAALVGYSLLTAAPEQGVSGEAVRDHIDQKSRDAMRDILRQADDRERR